MDDETDWASVMQFLTERMDFEGGFVPERPVAEWTEFTNLEPPEMMTPPTPPLLSMPENGQEDDGQATTVSVSTTFFPGSNSSSEHSDPDLIIRSSDSVLFYVHQHILRNASDNHFKELLASAALPDPASPEQQLPVLNVPEDAAVLNIVLHTMYDMSCTHYSPSFDSLCDAVRVLRTYGFDLHGRVTPATPLFLLLLAHAPRWPLEVYALSGHYDLHELAVPTSEHLLSLSVATLSDEIVVEMGALYLKRLFFLHFGREDALKRLLVQPPAGHTPTPECDIVAQKALARAWALAAAYLVWDARADISTTMLVSALSPLGAHLPCAICRASLRDRVKTLTQEWASIKRTI